MSVGLHSAEFPFFLVGSSHRELVVVGARCHGHDRHGVGGDGGGDRRLPADGRAAPRREPPAPAPTGRCCCAGDDRPSRHRPRRRSSTCVSLPSGLLPQVLTDFLAPGRTEPEHRIGSIAFLRFAGTDALLAEQGPEVVVDALDRTISAVQDAFVAEGVTLPAGRRRRRRRARSSPARACPTRARTTTIRCCGRCAASPTQTLPLPLAMGVNRGHVFVAEIGTARRATYSAMGDTTNTAARIAAKDAAGNDLRASCGARAGAARASRPRRWGRSASRGKQAPLTLYEVGEEIGTRTIATRERRPLVGRDQMWADLEATLEDASERRGWGADARGASGMGKSRLLEEAAAWAAVPALPAGARAEVLWLRAEPYGVNSAYGVFRDPLRTLLEVGGRDRADAAPSLAERVAVLDPSLVPLLPLLGDVMHLDVPPTPESEAIDPRFRPDVVAEVVGTVLGATIEGPLLILVDDAPVGRRRFRAPAGAAGGGDRASAVVAAGGAPRHRRRVLADDWPAVALPPLDERVAAGPPHRRHRGGPAATSPGRRHRRPRRRQPAVRGGAGPHGARPRLRRCGARFAPGCDGRTDRRPRLRRPAGSCATRRSSVAPSASTPSSRC